MSRRACAVVIGVNRTGGLTPLQSAAAGAERVAAWLRGEGFAVTCLTDATAPVTAAAVKAAIKTYATNPVTYDLLVVYFSGHGYWGQRGDQWLLSGAPEDPNEAVNLEGTMDRARYCGIPNLVFVSDACRSLSASRGAATVDGILAFPNYPDLVKPKKLDYFKATVEGTVAYEITIAGQAESVLTYALLEAYAAPEPDMVRAVLDGGQTLQVVPNRKLEGYLQRRIDDLLAAVNINLEQHLEAQVPSADDVYIARARGPVARPGVSRELTFGAPEPPRPGVNRDGTPATAESTADLLWVSARPAPRPSIGADAAAGIARSLSTRGFQGGAIAEVGGDLPETEAALQTRLPGTTIDHFETTTGLVVRGARLQAAIARTLAHQPAAELLTPGDGTAPAVVRLHPAGDGAPLSVVLCSADDGRCAIVAGLPGYLGHVLFGPDGVSNVSYVPSANTLRGQDYLRARADTDRLRALVAVAVEYNRLYVRSARDAAALVARLRVAGGIDPTLGLYAAHACSQAGEEDALFEVYQALQGNLSADLFDVRLLVSRRQAWAAAAVPVVPFCPLLTRSWALLGARGISLAPVLADAGHALCDSLWTTFQPGAAAALIAAIETGELQ